MPSRGGKKWPKAVAQIRKLNWSDGKHCFLIMELILNAAANWTGWCRGTCLQQNEGKLPSDSCQVCVCWHVKEPSTQIWLVCEGETTEKEVGRQWGDTQSSATKAGTTMILSVKKNNLNPQKYILIKKRPSYLSDRLLRITLMLLIILPEIICVEAAVQPSSTLIPW